MGAWGELNALPHMGPAHTAVLLREAARATGVLEWGSGGSTLLFAQAVARNVPILAIEHNLAWAMRVQNAASVMLHLLRTVPTIRVLPTEGDYATPDVPRQFSLCLVDGEQRPTCAETARRLLPVGGVLLWHDFEREIELHRRDWPGADLIPDPDFSVFPCSLLLRWVKTAEVAP